MADGSRNSSAVNVKIQLDLSWKCSPQNVNPSICSPMTDLAMNLEETCMVDTPKRRFSWSSTGSTSPCRPQLLSLKDDGFYDSPCDGPPICEERLPKSIPHEQNSTFVPPRSRSLLQRLHSVPSGPSWNLYSEQENVPKSENCNSCGSPLKKFGKDDKSSEEDCNSQDSGFNDKDEFGCSSNSNLDFKFTEPVGIAPRRLRCLYETGSPTKCEVSRLPLSPVSVVTLPRKFKSQSCSSEFFNKHSSVNEDGEDDGFLEEMFFDGPHDESAMPFGISQLITGKMPPLNPAKSPKGQLSTSRFSKDSDTPKLLQGKSCIRGLFGGKRSSCEGERKLALKRSEVPREVLSPIQNKRRKSMSFCYRQLENRMETEERKPSPKRAVLQRCYSESEATIMKAVQRSVQEPNLIGDFSKCYLLPLLHGRHQDLNCVSHWTVEKLVSGEFLEEIEKFLIVDCRYPYEYEGGHIRGALNIYTKEGIMQEFLANPLKTAEFNKRLVIVFHCEFSSERGPNLSRFLRNKDREANKECYPQLFYPEIYLLEGGYKSFYENHKHMCEPQEYKPMSHKDHQKDLVHFRAKSKSWNGDKSGRLGPRLGLKL